MSKLVRISKVVVSEDRNDSIVILDSGDELSVEKLSIEWDGPNMPVVTFTAKVLHGLVK